MTSKHIKLSSQVSDQLTLLQRLLAQNPRSSEAWGRISLIGAYIKRFCNLQLIYLENGHIPNRDFQISLNDMIDYMERIGILASLDFSPPNDLDATSILHVMQTLEAILESNKFRLNSIAIYIGDEIYFKISGDNISFEPFVMENNYRIEVETASDIYIYCAVNTPVVHESMVDVC